MARMEMNYSMDKLKIQAKLTLLRLVPYGFLFKSCKNYCTLRITWNHDKRCLCIKSNFFNADTKSEELNMSVL